MPDAYQDVRTNLQMFGMSEAQALENLGRGVGSLGETFGAIAERDIARANEAAASKARTALSQTINNDIYGADGFMSLQGENAVNAFAQQQQDFEDRYNALLAGLPSEEAQQIFRDATRTRMFEVQRAVAGHTRAQRLSMEAQLAGARLSEASRTARLAWNNPALLEDTLLEGEQIFRDNGARLGLPEEVIADQIAGYREGSYDEIVGLVAQQSPGMVLGLAGGPRFIGAADAPLGVRNNNPGNLMVSGDRWEGMTGQDAGGFVQFETPALGIRAMVRNLQNTYFGDGLTTIGQIAPRYAPEGHGDNDPNVWADRVAQFAGIGRDEVIDPADPEQMRALVQGIIHHENGVQPYGDDLIAGGVAMAGIGEMPEGFDPSAAGPALVTVATMAEPGPDAPVWWANASPQARAAAWRTADQFRRQQQTAARASLGPRLQDEETMQLSGVAVPSGSVVTRAEVDAAYDPAEADQVWQDMERVREAGALRRQVAGMHPSAQQALLDQARPEPGEDFGHQQELFNGLQSAIAADNEMRQQPARYVANHVPAVMDAWGMKEPDGAIGQLSPDEMRSAMEITLQAQADIGIPEGARVPMLEQAAAGFVMQWQAETDMAARLDMASAITIGLNDEMMARRVLRQLTDAGMPPEMPYILDVARNPGRRQNAMDLLFAVTAPIESPPTSDQRTDLQDELDDYWDASAVTVHLRAAFEQQDPRLALRSQDERAMFERVAERHMATYGDADAAIEYANQTLFGDVSTISDPGLAYLTHPAGVDGDTFADGLEWLRSELITIERGEDGEIEATALPLDAIREALQRQADLIGEDSVTGSVVVDDAMAMAYIRDLRFSAVWVNDGDDNYVLLDPETGLGVPGVGAETYSFSTRQVLEAAARRTQFQIDQRGGRDSTLERRLGDIERQMNPGGVAYY